ncbi:hypothetical protein HMI54_009139 [Coelomomyces lativittatus]|nr:hypothetical protein HMI54_009139 [Coelomomyces lativittatus]
MFPTQESLENLSELVWNPETLHPHQVYVRDQTLRYLNVKRAVQYWCDQFEMNYLNQDLANSSASSTSTPLFLSVEHVGQFFKSNLGMDLFEVLETCLNSLLAKYPHLVVVYGLSRESLLGLGTTGKDGPFVPISLKGLELPNHHAVLLDPLSEIEHGQYRELWKHYLTHLHWTYISRSLIRAYHCPPAMHAQFHSLTHPLVSVLPGLKNYIDVSVTKQKLDTFICSLIGFMNQSKIEASSSPTSPSPSSSSSSPSPSSSSSSNTRSNQLKMLCQRLLYPGLEHDILSLPDPLSPSSSHPSHSSSTDTSLSPSHPFPFPSTSSSSGNGNGSNTAGGGGVAGTGMSPFNRILPSKYRVLRPSDVHVTLDDVIGHSQAKLALRSLIQLPLQFPHHFKHGVLLKASSNGVLLYGPPGTGKTLLAKAIAKSSQSMFITVNPSDVFDKYVGESEKYVKGLFEKARQSKPCIIFLDEVDAVFSKRDLDLNGHRRDVLNEFCMQWEGLKENHGIIVLGATNRPFDLDEAVLRRFARRVLVDLPTSMEQLAILRHHLVGEQLHPEVNLNTIVDQLQHYSGSDIKNLCVAASMAAIRELESKGEIQKDRVLHARHFLLSLKEVKASAHKNLNSISRLREFEKTLSGSKTTEFGFRHRKDT